MLQQQGLLRAIAPNLVEGREFNKPRAVALDTSVTPPIFYLADFGNNPVVQDPEVISATPSTSGRKRVDHY